LQAPRRSVPAFGRGCKRQRLQQKQQQCHASMGISFTEDFQTAQSPAGSRGELLLPSSPEFGLSVKQMGLLGLTNQGVAQLPEAKAVRGTAGRVTLLGCAGMFGAYSLALLFCWSQPSVFSLGWVCVPCLYGLLLGYLMQDHQPAGVAHLPGPRRDLMVHLCHGTLCRSCLRPVVTMWATLLRPTAQHGGLQAWLLTPRRQARRRQTCRRCCWMAAFATLACR